jgi:hypothetical protein
MMRASLTTWGHGAHIHKQLLSVQQERARAEQDAAAARRAQAWPYADARIVG